MSDLWRTSFALPDAAAREYPFRETLPLGTRLLKNAGRIYAQAFHRLDVLSPPQLPTTGAAILICNHTSGIDPALIQAPCKRLIVWMMAKEYYDTPLRRGFEMLAAIPVDRGSRDLAPTRAALRALECGRIVGIFPEGKIETSRDLLPFHTGVAMMARRAKVDVYPAFLDGSQRGTTMKQSFTQAQHATVRFGGKIDLDLGASGSRKSDMAETTARIRAAVEILRDWRRP